MLTALAIIHDIIAGALILGCTAVLLAVIFVIS
jgi:hypothetical protein